MRYLKLIGKYIWVFAGAVLFGMAAVKVKSTERSKNRSQNKLREMSEARIQTTDYQIAKQVQKLHLKQAKATKARQNAIYKLDKVADNSRSVKSLLDDYNRDRMQFGTNGDSI